MSQRWGAEVQILYYPPMIHEFKNPIPVVTEIGDGYAIYVKDNGMHENDTWTIVLKDEGKIIHCLSNQIKIHCNMTFDIQKPL